MFLWTKGEDRRKPIKRHKPSGYEVPRGGSIPSAEKEGQSAVAKVNTEFGLEGNLRLREPFDVIHRGTEEQIKLYRQLAGLDD